MNVSGATPHTPLQGSCPTLLGLFLAPSLAARSLHHTLEADAECKAAQRRRNCARRRQAVRMEAGSHCFTTA